ncbi:hypothetical protein [Halorubrum lacusprofundi]|uniref:hypothetical protein n=1 Tax=Halorubrum lacusprofundi TaxID=2247 RepID=UPI00197A7B0B|nr:hypothetical protein [Halorubrum lacusprofundi]MCG1005061.1 hypothetical protein [Halorubrum lacusprofundi]
MTKNVRETTTLVRIPAASKTATKAVEIAEVIEKSDDLRATSRRSDPTGLRLGSSTRTTSFTPLIVVHPSDRDECELPDAAGPLIQSDRTEERLDELAGETDEAVVDD